MKRPQIVGIVNITGDSFSDGGKFLNAADAIRQAQKLLKDGADIIELSGASSNPHAGDVSAEDQIARMQPVLEALDCRISIDATKTEVLHWAISKGVAYLNDIKGFPDASLYPELRDAKCNLIAMHFISDLDKAVRIPKTPQEVFASIRTFFDARIKALVDAGIARERIVIDPGMGFFLASNPEPSLAMLAHTAAFKKRYGLPVMISVSRKSFLRNAVPEEDIDIQSRTLAAEIYASLQGADYIRTHDVRALNQGLAVWNAIEKVGAKTDF